MIRIERYINELMTSNCYIVWDDVTKGAIVIDPASEHSLREIAFIEENDLRLDYIILTHEHTDHTWGVNAIVQKFNPDVICSCACKDSLPKAGDMYFRLYYDDPNYSYAVCRVDMTTEELNNKLMWDGKIITFVPSPGHSAGSICIKIDDFLFSGDTLMQYKPYVNKKSGSIEVLKQTVEHLLSSRPNTTIVYPGHGEMFRLSDYTNLFR
ncbi:MAG: MBL fold metallo-hydrolase [Prevotella sp.]|nr:MBL fold metallo-hydrolase [Prevotella sp.]